MFIWNRSPFVGIVSRPKLNGLGKHVGVALPDSRVAHMTVQGPVICSAQGFAQGHHVTYEKRARPGQHSAIQQRAEASVGRSAPYHLLNRNCEHYATWLLGETPASPQVAGALLIGALSLFAFAR